MSNIRDRMRQGRQELNEGKATGSYPDDEMKALFDNVKSRKQVVATLKANDIRIGGFQMTPRGLVVADDANQSDWQEVGHVLYKLQSGLNWLIGDWFVWGESQYGDITALAEEIGFSEATVRDWKYVSNNVQMSVRTDISWSCHKLVAALPEDEQRHWLQQAVDNNWSVSALRKAMKDAQQAENPPKALPETPYTRLREHRGYKSISAVQKAISKDKLPSAKDLQALKEWIAEIEAIDN